MEATKTNPDRLQLHQMFKLMDELQNLGARDSEPMGCLDLVLEAASEGKVFPDCLIITASNPNPWELFEDLPGWRQANRRLTAQAKKVWAEARKG